MKKSQKIIIIGIAILLIVVGTSLMFIVPTARYTTETKKKEEYAEKITEMKKVVESKADADLAESGTKLYKLSDLLSLDEIFKSPFGNFVDEYTYILVTKENGKIKYIIQGLDESGWCVVATSDKTITKNDVKSNCKVDSLSSSISDDANVTNNSYKNATSSKSTKSTSSYKNTTSSKKNKNSDPYKSSTSNSGGTIIHNETNYIPKNRLYGDVDLNGNVDIMDATTIQKYVANKITLSSDAKANADVNLDGKINNKDTIIIQKYIAELISSLPYTGTLVIYGDVNLDGDVTLEDVTALQYYTSGKSSLNAEARENADVNLDGKTDDNDVAVIQLYLAEKATLPYRNVSYGDVNLDGSIDVTDLSELQKYIAERITLNDQARKNADVNLDGSVNVLDETLLQKYLAGMIELPSRNVNYRKRYR